MMMKKYASLLFALVLALSLSVSAAADSSGVYVYDDAALLTQEEYDTLTASAMAVADQYGCGVYVVPVDDVGDVSGPAAEYEPLSFGDKLFFAALMAFRFGLPLGLIVAFIVCAIYKRQLKSVRRATEAARYTVSGGAEITAREDRFTHTTEVRTPIKTESDDHDSGPSFSGGTTVNSGGFSHSGGKF